MASAPTAGCPGDGPGSEGLFKAENPHMLKATAYYQGYIQFGGAGAAWVAR